MDAGNNTLISHLEALRRTLLRIFGATALCYPAAFLLSPHVIELLVRWSFPPEIGQLHYFSPMEVLWVQLKLALVMALVIAAPWNIFQCWRFLLPALYREERRALGWWIVTASVLFLAGAAFCAGAILPMVMRFSGGFATPEVRPIIGMANFINLAGWLALSFGVMFQAPLAVLLAVRFGAVSASALSRKRPYVLTVILIVAALLTPPDVVSQVMLAVPTWLLFELGLILAKRMEKRSNEPT